MPLMNYFGTFDDILGEKNKIKNTGLPRPSVSVKASAVRLPAWQSTLLAYAHNDMKQTATG